MTVFLRMNDSKTEFMIIGTRQQLAKLNFSTLKVANVVVESVSDLRNLGSIFDEHMSMSAHIQNKCKTSFYHLYNISKIRNILDDKSCEMLIHSLIFSQLDYCNSLLYGVPNCELVKCQRVINSAARLVCKERKYCHITPLLSKLHWLPISYRIQFKILLLVFKCLNDMAPVYLTNFIKIRRRNRSSRHRPLMLEVPFVRRATLAARAFDYAGPFLWNSLPADIVTAQSISDFKTKLKTHFMKIAYDL